MRDFYEILEVSRTSSTEEIKKSYKRLAKENHPDLHPGDVEKETKFKEINYAYEILIDPQKRKNYDLYGEEGVNSNASGGFGGFSDIFDDIFDIFGGGFTNNSQRKNYPRKGASIRKDLNIDFFEACFGTKKEISFTAQTNCEHCNGEGKEPGSSVNTCDKCGGSGQINIETNSPFGRFVRVETCDKCAGSGEIITEKCKVCHGRKKIAKKKKIQVDIPPGVEDEMVLSMKNEAHAGENGGENGDLFIYLHVKEDPVFKRKGNDIFIDIPISYPDAVLGTNLKVPTLKSLVDYEIPKGTQAGETFRIKGEGVPYLRKNGRGDLYFTVNIIIPKKIDQKQRQLLEQLRDNQPEVHHEQKGFFERFKDLF